MMMSYDVHFGCNMVQQPNNKREKLGAPRGLAGVAFASGYEQLMVLRLAVGLGVASTFTSAGRWEGICLGEGWCWMCDLSH